MSMHDCLFCKIAQHEVPATIVQEDERAIAFRDITPQAPTHILVVPKKHIASLDEASAQDRELLGHLLLLVQQIARSEELTSGYRTVINNGVGAGQSVFHIHLHLLAGRALRWPPG